MKKQTGIIRRIDDLGRIVIPKGLRDQLKIEEGQPFEIFLTEKGVAMDVYKPEPNKGEIAMMWLNRNQWLMDRYKPQFFHNGKNTCCVAITPQKDDPFSIGKARCATSDKYEPHIGEVISFCRAVGMSGLIPEELLK